MVNVSLHFYRLAVLTAIIAVTRTAFASPDSIVGYWMFEKAVGEPCRSQIIDLEYGFYSDGKYEINSEMNLGITKKKLNAKGTYKIAGDKVTGFVDGNQIGPFKYRVQNNRLTIYQGSPSCEVHLVREE